MQIKKIPVTDIIVGTPGRILDHLKRKTLRLDNVKILVLDEVDRMFDMGFQRDVESIIRECPKKRQTMLFSATISQDIDYLAKKHTQDAIKISVKSYVDHKKLKQNYYDVPKNLKFSLLVHLLRKESSELVMVFCNTRRNVDFIAKNLKNSGIYALAIHGGLPQHKRIKTLKEFHGKTIAVLVCTDVDARGLDIKGVSHIYNYDLPKTSKDYIHRIGRTARAGEEGKAINILSERDYDNFGNILRDESLKITKVELPKIELVRIKSDFSRNRKRSFGRRSYNQDDRGSFNKREPRTQEGDRTNFKGDRTNFVRGQRNNRGFRRGSGGQRNSVSNSKKHSQKRRFNHQRR